MKTNYTKQLFYKKYPYKISIVRNTTFKSRDYFNGWTVVGCKEWMSRNDIEYRIYSNIDYNDSHDHKQCYTVSLPKYSKVAITASIFVTTKKNFDKAVAEWKDIIGSVTVPYDDTHIKILENDRSVIIRKTLMYKKYRYVVSFKTTWNGWGQPVTINAAEWVNDSFTPNAIPDTFKCYIYGNNPRLYLINEDDLMLVKLSLNEEITRIIEILTFDELKKTN